MSTPYLIIVVAMGYTRQSAAIGLALIAFLCLEKKNLLGFIWWILLATLFHKTALILLVAAISLIQDIKTIFGKFIAFLLIALSGIGLFYTFLSPQLDFFVYGYEEQAMQSQGAGIRVAMIVLPALFINCLSKQISA